MAKKSTVIKDFSTFQAVHIHKGKPLTGADPVLLNLIKKAAGRGTIPQRRGLE